MAIEIVKVQGADGVLYDVIGDVIGGVFHPLYGMEFGEIGVATKVSTPNPLPVSLAHIDPALTIAEGEIAGHSHINKFVLKN